MKRMKRYISQRKMDFNSLNQNFIELLKIILYFLKHIFIEK